MGTDYGHILADLKTIRLDYASVPTTKDPEAAIWKAGNKALGLIYVTNAFTGPYQKMWRELENEFLNGTSR